MFSRKRSSRHCPDLLGTLVLSVVLALGLTLAGQAKMEDSPVAATPSQQNCSASDASSCEPVVVSNRAW